MDDKFRDLIFQAIDGTISPSDFERLQDAIESDDDVCFNYWRSIELCESLGELATGKVEPPSESAATGDQPVEPAHRQSLHETRKWGWPQLLFAIAVAASILALVSGIAFRFGQQNNADDTTSIAENSPSAGSDESPESLIAGHATLRRSVDLKWGGDSDAYREGDVLPDGTLRFEEGVAEIDFFCGATLIVEGPATLDVESDWSVRVIEGRLRASVPPAARGFIVKAEESEIVDLGTEFAVEVGVDHARVEVIDGEVELRGGEHDGNHLFTGERQWLKGNDPSPQNLVNISTVTEIQRRREDAQSKQFESWKSYSQELRADSRLIAYYPIAEAITGRFIPNRSLTGSQRDGTLVGSVNRASGRFGAESASLEFARPGSRVRTRIDGEFSAFTFACWARIDSLEHRYNALFMGDGYENGEPHWQIRDDGKLMFSVMVDDTPGAGNGTAKDARLHRVYFTDPIWDVSQSGKWIHIAAVYDPANHQVTQFVNGMQIASEDIVSRFHVTSLRIGAAEIGNWGQPLRDSPWFAVRNLNGAIDELAIFDAALAPHEILSLYDNTKPLGY